MSNEISSTGTDVLPGDHETLEGQLQELSARWLTGWGSAACQEAATVLQRQKLALLGWQKLRDPVVLHANLLRGRPARLTQNQALHLIGDDADRIAEIEAENLRLKRALKEATELMGTNKEAAGWRERWAVLLERGNQRVEG